MGELMKSDHMCDNSLFCHKTISNPAKCPSWFLGGLFSRISASYPKSNEAPPPLPLSLAASRSRFMVKNYGEQLFPPKRRRPSRCFLIGGCRCLLSSERTDVRFGKNIGGWIWINADEKRDLQALPNVLLTIKINPKEPQSQFTTMRAKRVTII